MKFEEHESGGYRMATIPRARRRSILAAVIGTALAAGIALAVTVVVQPLSMDGWRVQTVGGTGTAGGFQAGPGVPPSASTGSLHETIGPANGTDFVSFRNVDYAGVKLSELTNLTYNTWVTSNFNCQAA